MTIRAPRLLTTASLTIVAAREIALCCPLNTETIVFSSFLAAAIILRCLCFLKNLFTAAFFSFSVFAFPAADFRSSSSVKRRRADPRPFPFRLLADPFLSEMRAPREARDLAEFSAIDSACIADCVPGLSSSDAASAILAFPKAAAIPDAFPAAPTAVPAAAFATPLLPAEPVPARLKKPMPLPFTMPPSSSNEIREASLALRCSWFRRSLFRFDLISSLIPSSPSMSAEVSRRRELPRTESFSCRS